MDKRYAVAITLSCTLAGCGVSAQRFSEAMQAFAAGAASAAPTLRPTKLMVFGGEGHKTYLGCLNCGEYASDSIANQYGSYGSRYSITSMANSYGEFGSKYSTYSACNPYAADPPVIVDANGDFYGRLTSNAYNYQRVRDEEVLAWLTAVCEH